MSKPLDLKKLFEDKTKEELVEICSQLLFGNLSDERLTRIEELEEALDKACEVMTGRVNIDSGDGTPTLRFTKEQWKEWCMKDE